MIVAYAAHSRILSNFITAGTLFFFFFFFFGLPQGVFNYFIKPSKLFVKTSTGTTFAFIPFL